MNERDEIDRILQRGEYAEPSEPFEPETASLYEAIQAGDTEGIEHYLDIISETLKEVTKRADNDPTDTTAGYVKRQLKRLL